MGNGINSSRVASTTSTLSGSATINALLNGYQWGTGNGATVSLTYSFQSSNSYYATDYSGENEYRNSQPLYESQKTAVRTALSAWARVANLSFTEIADSSTQAGDLRFGTYNNLPAGTGAWGYFPGSSAVAGDVWFNDTQQSTSTAPGAFFIALSIHEIGHALGLKHPFEAESFSAYTLPSATDNDDWTVMSYTHQNTIYTVTPLALDINAIQYLYGPNTTTTAGNDSYQLGAADQAIWDYAGTDTLVGAATGLTYTLDLRAGAASTGTGSAGTARYYVMPNVTIENATGGSGNDTLIGNSADNTLTGGAGSDVIDGGDGTDTAVFDGSYANYTVTTSGVTTTVRDRRTTASLGTDTLTNVERLSFADQTVVLSGATTTAITTASVTGSAVYRFHNPSTGAYFYTSSSTERDLLRAATGTSFSYEGPAFSTAGAAITDSIPVYRFYNSNNGTHFFTANEAEKNILTSGSVSGYAFEGVAYRAVSTGSANASLPGLAPLYRFYNTSNQTHFYTASPNEQAILAADRSGVYAYEGIACYVASSTASAASAGPAAAALPENLLQGETALQAGTTALDTALPAALAEWDGGVAPLLAAGPSAGQDSASSPVLWLAHAAALPSAPDAGLAAPFDSRQLGGVTAGLADGTWMPPGFAFA